MAQEEVNEDTQAPSVVSTLKAADALHNAMLELVGELISLDPPKDSAEGKLLNVLVTAIENYEKVVYPI